MSRISLAVTLAFAATLAPLATACDNRSSCGNGTPDPGEACDGANLGGLDCVALGFTGGALACSAACTLDTTACSGTGPVCGNGLIDAPELCDGADLGGEDCGSQGFTGGTLACTGGCAAFDASGCIDGVIPCDVSAAVCTVGNPTTCACVACNPNSICDIGDDCVCPDCAAELFCSNPLNCNGDGICDPYNEGCVCADCAAHPVCTTPPVCGNGVVEPGEACDGANLAGEDCVSQGFLSGELICSPNCGAFLTGNCSERFWCENVAIHPECTIPDRMACVCLGCNTDGICGVDDDCVCPDCLNDLDCTYDDCNGDVVCDPFLEGCGCADCQDHPLCANLPTCGDGMINLGETCDGTDLGGADCLSLGFTGGTLGCFPNCLSLDASGCTGGGLICDVSAGTCTVGDPMSCACVGCLDDGTCSSMNDDCVCADCAAEPFCADPLSCVADGFCNPYVEGCVCPDCMNHPLCP